MLWMQPRLSSSAPRVVRGQLAAPPRVPRGHFAGQPRTRRRDLRGGKQRKPPSSIAPTSSNPPGESSAQTPLGSQRPERRYVTCKRERCARPQNLPSTLRDVVRDRRASQRLPRARSTPRCGASGGRQTHYSARIDARLRPQHGPERLDRRDAGRAAAAARRDPRRQQAAGQDGRGRRQPAARAVRAQGVERRRRAAVVGGLGAAVVRGVARVVRELSKPRPPAGTPLDEAAHGRRRRRRHRRAHRRFRDRHGPTYFR